MVWIYLSIIMWPNQVIRTNYSIKKLIQGPSQQIWCHFSNKVLFRGVHLVDVESGFIVFVLAMFNVLLLESEIRIMEFLYQLLSVECVCHKTNELMSLKLDSLKDCPCLKLHFTWTLTNS